MLVLSRKTGEAISLGPNIMVKVVAVEGDRVRIGIEAPSDIRIFRTELLMDTISTNKQAMSTPMISFKKPDEGEKKE
ncbi:carbon storage regulator CsrA [Eubacteriales bacterium OttesenSCG-928-N14]|nr:carbon storage regulator CsrA [Eubacteriales bacterium OttesenSCG-928-N14]